METWTTVLYVLVGIVCVALIGLVLIQPSKSGGFGSGGSAMGESVFGAYAGSHLTKLTVIFTAILFVLTLILAAFVGRAQKSVISDDAVAEAVSVAEMESAVEDIVQESVEAEGAAETVPAVN